jgi:4-alpha-glucanotransferase
VSDPTGGPAGPRHSRALAELATQHGVSLSYADTQGDEHHASPEAVAAVLAALGVPIDHPDGAVEALRVENATPVPVIEPVVVHWTGSSTLITVVLPRHTHPRDVWMTLELAAGERVRRRLLSVVSRPLTSGLMHGRQVDRYQLRLWSGSEELPIGYHHLVLEVDGTEHRSLVICAPRCPRPDRGWGIFHPLHAARGEHDRGIGTYTDLGGLTQWVGEQGGSFVGTLPLLATFLGGDPVDPSPYLPESRLAWNEIFVDPTGLPEFGRSEEAQQAWGNDSAPRLGRVDYASVAARLRSTLAPMVGELVRAGSARLRQLEVFVTERPHLRPYAAFRATRSGFEEGGKEFQAAVASTLYAQWAAETQVTAAGTGGAGLYLDIPVGIDPDGFDPVWEPDAFVSGVRGGAPPDAFFSGGQDWGFPPLNPQGLRRREYGYFVASLRQVMDHASVVRLDHVMGLHRLFWIPQGGQASDGVYVDYPAEELRAVVALEAATSGTVVVGEDLGTVPDGLRADMAHDRMLRSWVFQFDSSVEEPLPAAPRTSLAGWGTHDLPTFAAHWGGIDLDEREADGSLSATDATRERQERREWRTALCAALGIEENQPELALRGCLDHMAAGPALLTVVDLEDLWLEVEPQNHPGTGPEAGNWRRRSARTLGELRTDPAIAAALTVVEGLRRSGAHDPRPVEPASTGSLIRRRP